MEVWDNSRKERLSAQSRYGQQTETGYTAGLAGVAQLVEHQLPKLRVVGSSPIARFSVQAVSEDVAPPSCPTRALNAQLCFARAWSDSTTRFDAVHESGPELLLRIGVVGVVVLG